MSTSTISNTLTDASGDPVVGARVVARLVPSPAFRVGDASEIQPLVETATDENGEWSLVLEEQANITPSDSHYEIIEYQDDRPRRHTIQVAATDQSLFAALVTPPPAADGNTYITQASGDARYQQLGGGFGSVSSVGTANASGASSAAARADHVHDIGNGAIDSAALLAPNVVTAAKILDGEITQAKLVSGLKVIRADTAAPSSPAPTEGELWYDTDDDLLHVRNGSGWVCITPKGAVVATSQGTGTGSFTDLGTVGPSVSLLTGTKAIVTLGSFMNSNTAADGAAMGFAVSGATTIAASDAFSISKIFSNTANTMVRMGETFYVTGLTAGVNTFTAKYKALVGGIALWSDRHITVVGLP